MSETLVKPAPAPAAAASPANPRDAWVERVLGVSLRGTAPAAADAAAVRGRLNEVGIAVRDLKGVPGADTVTAQFARAAAAFKAGDLSDAERLLDEAAAAAAALRPAVAAAELGDGPSLRAVATAALQWRRVCAKAQADIPALKDAVLREMEADDDFDPSDVDTVRTELDRLDAITDTVTDELADLVDDLVEAAPAQRSRAAAVILKAVADQEAFVRGSDLIKVLPDNGVMSIDLAGPVMATLAGLREALAKVETA